MWASDFPHCDCTWPNSRKIIDGEFADVPEQIGFEPASHRLFLPSPASALAAGRAAFVWLLRNFFRAALSQPNYRVLYKIVTKALVFANV